MKKLTATIALALLSVFAIVTSVNAADLPGRFYGKYTSVNCSECYWVLNSDETGQWSVGLMSGRTEVVPVMWEPMIDDNGNLQTATKGDLQGYAIKIFFAGVMSDDVRGVMRTANRDSGTAMVVIWYNDSDAELQFMSETNGFYMKD